MNFKLLTPFLLAFAIVLCYDLRGRSGAVGRRVGEVAGNGAMLTSNPKPKPVPVVAVISNTVPAPAAPLIDFERAADAIFRHENSKRFPYGVRIKNSKGNYLWLTEKQARRECISLLKEEFTDWNKQGNFFKYANTRYTDEDTNWWRGVSKIYNSKKL